MGLTFSKHDAAVTPRSDQNFDNDLQEETQGKLDAAAKQKFWHLPNGTLRSEKDFQKYLQETKTENDEEYKEDWVE
eukprot:CAMPEP_0178915064 /NCGR_PEP_ID=MMETSP0786-20121207/11798_1 /TAXON_ID=186022 /ORGANISM="Thalassionema frauenfeldii, Strain CCMP 1798" /LENGTH=75 /DNA_ID=CAMNT_0020588091 /DNA_START=50 /DNA_END=277 /DNA_ORIENTATION=+